MSITESQEPLLWVHVPMLYGAHVKRREGNRDNLKIKYREVSGAATDHDVPSYASTQDSANDGKTSSLVQRYTDKKLALADMSNAYGVKGECNGLRVLHERHWVKFYYVPFSPISTPSDHSRDSSGHLSIPTFGSDYLKHCGASYAAITPLVCISRACSAGG